MKPKFSTRRRKKGYLSLSRKAKKINRYESVIRAASLAYPDIIPFDKIHTGVCSLPYGYDISPVCMYFRSADDITTEVIFTRGLCSPVAPMNAGCTDARELSRCDDFHKPFRVHNRAWHIVSLRKFKGEPLDGVLLTREEITERCKLIEQE